MNQLNYPIQNNVSTSMLISQFNNYNISTSYFLNIFKNYNGYTVNKCLINNQFIDDLIELISLITITTLDRQLGDYTIKFDASLTGLPEDSPIKKSINNYIDSFSADKSMPIIYDINNYITYKDRFIKLIDLYLVYSFTSFTYTDTTNNTQINIGDLLHITIDTTQDQDLIDRKDIIKNTIDNYKLITNNIRMMSFFTQEDTDIIDRIYSIYFNLGKNLKILSIFKLYILLKYINYIDNNETRKHIINLIEKISNAFSYTTLEFEYLYPLLEIFDWQFAIKPNAVTSPILLQTFGRVYPRVIESEDIQNEKNYEYETIIDKICSDIQGVSYAFVSDDIDTIMINICIIYNYLVPICTQSKIFNRSVELINSELLDVNIGKMDDDDDILELGQINYYIYKTLSDRIDTFKNVTPVTFLNEINMCTHSRFSEFKVIDVNAAGKTRKLEIICAYLESMHFFIKNDHLAASLNVIATYLISEKFAYDICESVREYMQTLPNQFKKSLINQINNNKLFSNVEYIKNILIYLDNSNETNLNNCFLKVTNKEIRSNIFLQLYEIIHNYSAPEPLFYIGYYSTIDVPNNTIADPPSTDPDAYLEGVDTYIIPFGIPLEGNLHPIPLKSISENSTITPVRKLDDQSTLNVKNDITDINYTSSIFNDMSNMNYNQYDIVEIFEKQNINENIISKYKSIITIHDINQYDLNDDMVSDEIDNREITFNYKYRTAYSRIYLIYTYLNKKYKSIKYNNETNSYDIIQNKYDIDSKISIILKLCSIPKINILEKLCSMDESYVAHDKDEKQTTIRDLLNKLVENKITI